MQIAQEESERLLQMEPEDPVTSARRVRQCWDTYAAAIRGADGETALKCIDEQSVNWYESARELAIAGKRRMSKSLKRLVALIDGVIVGTLQYRLDGQAVHMMGPMVHHDHRRRGVAEPLDLQGLPWDELRG